jgi:CRP-like cAMP-binding protein
MVIQNINGVTSKLLPQARAVNDFAVASSRDHLSALKTIIRTEGVRTYAERGKCLFRQGEQVDKFFLIAHGGVALARHGVDGSSQVLDFFFDEAVLSDMKEANSPATYSAQCLIDTHAYAISASSLRRSFAADSDLMFDCNQLLKDLLNRAYGNLTNLGCCHGEERVAYLLCMIHDSMSAASTRLSHIPVRQIDIANAIGMTPVYVNQILKNLKKHGAINMNKGAIEIVDARLLRELSGLYELAA